MIRLFQILAVLAVIVGVSFAGWYYQPWSDYSPAKIAALQNPDKFPTTFQTFDKSLPFRAVTPGSQPRLLEKALLPLATDFPVGDTRMTVEDYHGQRNTTSLMVLKDGRIVHESYFLGASPDTRHTSWSVAKSFVATAIFKAFKAGLIESLDDKAAKYAPKYAGTGYGDTSIKALLAMSSGVTFDENYSKQGSDVRKFFFNAFIFREDVDTLLQPFERTHPELTDFSYTSPNSQVLSAVLRGIYDKPLAEIISAEIWHPLGMADPATWSMHRPGYRGIALGYCCLNATAGDYARFGQFWLDTINGTGPGVAMLPDNAADLILKPVTKHHFPNTGKYGDRGYSHHFWIPPGATFNEAGQTTEVFAAGVYGQYIWIDTSRNIVIVRTAGDPKWTQHSTENFAFFRFLASHYGD